MNSTKILNAVRLPTLSRTLQEILKLESGNPFTMTTNMRRIIEKDPLLSAHILKVANSSFYGFSQQVRTISHALGLLGVQRIKQIAFSFSIFDYFNRISYKAEYRQIFHQIIKKSLLQSSLALLIANRIGETEPEEFYMSTLLNDIGQIILFLYDPKTLQEIYHVEDRIVLEREQQRFGISHRELGLAFCLRFLLPEQIALSIGHHTEKIGTQVITRVSHVANAMAELLMQSTASELPRHMESLSRLCSEQLGIQLSSLGEALRTLPKLLEAFVSEFPELSDELQEVVGRGSALALSLMSEQISLVTESHRMDDLQKKIAKEKLFLSHMLNLSYYLSSLISPEKIIQSVFDYFDNFITDFGISFLLAEELDSSRYCFMPSAQKKVPGLLLTDLPPLKQALESHGTTRLEPQAMKRLQFGEDETILAFPIAFNQNLFGFLLLDLGKESFRELDLELSYIQILSNIMANSFQNYNSFERINSESNKKKILTRELVRTDQKVSNSRKTISSLQKTESLTAILPVVFHKLKNKLTPILGYTQILLSRSTDEAVRNRLEKIERNAEELTQQLNHLRSYFSVEPPPMERINPNRIISRMAMEFDRLEKQHGITVQISTDTDIGEIQLNPGQIETLVENLTENAILAVLSTPSKQGTVEIRTRALDDGAFALEVKDEGIGIENEEINKIWLPFNSTFPERAGLGLAVCHRILENHNAACDVESSPGKGSLFRVVFPAKGATLAVEDEVVEKTSKHPDLPPRKVLVIDDEVILLELMRDILEAGELDLAITICSTGQAALNLLKEQTFDLIISDIHMPDIGGMDIYQYLKSIGQEDRMIIVTGDPYPPQVTDFLKNSGIPYMKKPFELMEFKRSVFEKLT